MPGDPSLHGVPAALRAFQDGLIVAIERDGIPVVGVVGAGTMGAGIAQLALEHGHEVVLHDVDEAAIQRGRARVEDGLTRRARSLELDDDSIDDWVSGRLAGLRDAHSLDAVGAEAEVVIEAALEDLDLKRTIFRALDAVAAPEVILATNTSALSVAAIAESTGHPERVIGLHFFNPAPLMPLVEIVITQATDPAIVAQAASLVEGWGKTPVPCSDTPGFIVNRVNRPFTIQALRMLEAGVASIEVIDEAIRDAGFPMGPFELMDLIGIDVNLATARAVWDGLGRPDRLRPSPIQERLLDAGDLGRKTGRGFYVYDRAGRSVNERASGLAEASSDRRPLAPSAVVEAIRSAIAAEASLAVADGVATAADIELALHLGAGHPTPAAGPVDPADQPAEA
jgi:3-hydroxybutyryl-CoA dehydrogenase